MKEKKSRKKRIVIVIAVVLAILLAVGGGIAWMMNNEQKKMNPLDNAEIIPGVFAVRNGFVNIYLLKGADSYIAIDAGMNVSQTTEALDLLGISGDSVSAVLLTHSHGDHTGALKVFNNAAVYAAKQDIADYVLSDGNSFEVDNIHVQVISTPGHADDSVCFLIDGKYLFVGDNMSLRDGNVGLFNSIYNKSDEQQIADIKKLSGLSGIEYIFTAHYGFTDNPAY